MNAKKIRFTSILITLVILAASALWIEKSRAASNNLTGSCGFLVQRNFGGFGNAQIGYNFTSNIIGIINFDNNTVDGTLNQLFNHQQSNANIVTTSKSLQPIQVSNGPFSGSYYVYLSGNSNSDKQPIIIVPVNGGNTFLISQSIPNDSNGNDPALTGVCQKL